MEKVLTDLQVFSNSPEHLTDKGRKFRRVLETFNEYVELAKDTLSGVCLCVIVSQYVVSHPLGKLVQVSFGVSYIYTNFD